MHLAWSNGDAPRLRVKVCDEADTMPQVVEPPRPAGHGGYGLRLLERFSNDWGVERRDRGGKCVWFEVGKNSDWQVLGEIDHGLRRVRPQEELLS